MNLDNLNLAQPYATAFIFSLVTVFLKSFQHKNVIHTYYWWTAGTSLLMAVLDFKLVGMVSEAYAKQDWWVAACTGSGATIGMVTGMYIHARFVAKKEPAHASV